MYSIDDRDRVIEIHDLLQSDVGAPSPIVVADESRVLLAYLLAEPGQPDFGRPERWAIVEIEGCWAHFFGPPNDEALHGHPLYDRGLTPYSVFEVRNSSWIRLMERRNRVHDKHDPSRFAQLVHFIFTFHDSTFECVGKSLVSTVEDGGKDFVTNLARRLYAQHGADIALMPKIDAIHAFDAASGQRLQGRAALALFLQTPTMTVVASWASAARPYKLRLGADNGVNFLSEFIKPLPAAMNHDPRQHSGMDGR